MKIDLKAVIIYISLFILVTVYIGAVLGIVVSIIFDMNNNIYPIWQLITLSGLLSFGIIIYQIFK